MRCDGNKQFALSKSVISGMGINSYVLTGIAYGYEDFFNIDICCVMPLFE
jgi:hypothetical protein